MIIIIAMLYEGEVIPIVVGALGTVLKSLE